MGKFLLRLTDETYAKVAKRAARSGKNLQEQIEYDLANIK